MPMPMQMMTMMTMMTMMMYDDSHDMPQAWMKVATAAGVACSAAAHAADNARQVLHRAVSRNSRVLTRVPHFHQMWSCCVSLLSANFSRAARRDEACDSEDEVVTCVREVCVLALLHWAVTWSGAAAAKAAAFAMSVAVAQFLESSLILVHVPAAHRLARDHWLSASELCEDVTAVWLEEVAGRIEWTVVQQQQQQQQQQQGALSLKLKVLADASNEFPHYPALRTLGDV